MIYDTIREAATAWVDGFNAVPVAVVEKLIQLDPDEVREITPGERDENARYEVVKIRSVERIHVN